MLEEQPGLHGVGGRYVVYPGSQGAGDRTQLCQQMKIRNIFSLLGVTYPVYKLVLELISES